MKTEVKLVFNALVSFVASQALEVLPTTIAESISEPISGVSLEYINEGDMHAAHADNGTSIPKKVISLFVRTFHGSKDEYHSFLLKTAAEFWPALEHEQLEVVLDAGSTLDADMGKTIQHTWPYPSVSYATIPDDLRKIGHVLQQEAYLYADIYTQNRSEFVGMVDTDR